MRCGAFPVWRRSLALASVLLCGAADAGATPGASPLPTARETPLASRQELLVYRIPRRATPPTTLVYTLAGSHGPADTIATRAVAPTAARRATTPPVAGALVYARPRAQSLDDLIARVARAYRIEPSLVKAVIAAESDFDPLAVSPRGAQGMMQLMPGTARELGVVRPFAVEDNVDGGVRYLRWMLDRYGGNADHALAAYNAGPGAVDAYGGIPPYEETRRYVRRVRTLHRSYQHAFTR